VLPNSHRIVPTESIQTGQPRGSCKDAVLDTKDNRWSGRCALAALLAGASGIGFAPILVRLSEVGPAATAFFRILLALPVLWLMVAIERRTRPDSPRPTRLDDFLWLGLAGLFFTGDLAVWHWSLQFTTVTNSTLLTNCAPLLVTVGAWLILSENITLTFVFGMILAICGAALLAGASLSLSVRHLWGDLLALSTALFYAGYLLTVKKLRATFSAATVMAWSGVVSCLGLFLVAGLSHETLRPRTAQGWNVLIALALVSHVGGQALIAFALGHLPASFSSVSLLWQPAVAAPLAWLILKEPISFKQGVGGLVVLGGILVAGKNAPTQSKSPQVIIDQTDE
jgi:drug/metabolite transporter (DMT)-like permease